jgi:hypothetical protein
MLQASFLLDWFSTLKAQVIRSAETSVDMTTKRCIPEDGNIHNYRCENLESYIRVSYVHSVER